MIQQALFLHEFCFEFLSSLPSVMGCDLEVQAKQTLPLVNCSGHSILSLQQNETRLWTMAHFMKLCSFLTVQKSLELVPNLHLPYLLFFWLPWLQSLSLSSLKCNPWCPCPLNGVGCVVQVPWTRTDPVWVAQDNLPENIYADF